ncbi:translationally controlled tumor protein-like protein [Microthyrium microscopicum]|uniref:Translationally-controlled tumor protein homolog n=1 Tax=Microthyrium microscopicum TaxID=703497 RepID=A0A6A6TYX8_9PEZI|nr:translationally controlled tumor protein-like protein [Microthyrium microscopicum]
MLIFEDIVTGAELISDGWDMNLIDGVVYEADCKRKTVGGESFDTGANPSAEDEEEAIEENKETVIDVVHDFGYQETQFDKKGYLTYLKGYMKMIETKLTESGAPAEEIATFKKGAGAYAKKIAGNFGDYEMFIGARFDEDKGNHMIVLLNYREDGVTPYVVLWKHGLKEMKV